MTFRKIAQVVSLGAAVSDGKGLKKVASHGDRLASHFLDGKNGAERVLDVEGLLNKVAESYAISANPSDYVYEAIRALSTNVPNENNDAFTKDELLRFDTRKGTVVYRTFEGKPHHIEHRADNPKMARGVILDAHYFDDTPALDNCPRCKTATRDIEARDPSGVHCRKCGHVVKDEFVEILVAIDAKKDPALAEGVRTGLLKSGSMGCNCVSTTCNVCSHVAYSPREFCDHIKGASKGSWWAKTANTAEWKRIERPDAQNLLKKAGYEPATDRFVFAQLPDGTQIRRAHENCAGVEFDEYSRVDRPADPEALQRGVITASVASKDAPSPAEIRAETEKLIHRARARLAKTAGPLADRHKGLGQEAAEIKTPDDGSGEVQVEVAPGDSLNVISPPMGGEPTDMGVVPGQPPAGPGMPGAPGPGEIADQYTQPGASMSGQGTGMMDPNQAVPPGTPPAPGAPPPRPRRAPPGASAPRKTSARRFAAAYQAWAVDVMSVGSAVLQSPRGPTFIFRAGKQLATEQARQAFGTELMDNLQQHGLVDTVQKFAGKPAPKLAQVLDGFSNDVKESLHALYSTSHEGYQGDTQKDREGPSATSTSGMAVDHKGGPGKPSSDALVGREKDHEKEEAVPSSIMQDDHADTRQKHKDAPADALKGGERDHGAKLASEERRRYGERLQKVYAKRHAELEKRLVEEKKAFEENLLARVARAITFVAQRRLTNLEESPLKATLFEVLAADRVVGQDAATGEDIVHEGLNPELASHFVEAAFHEGLADEVETLIQRTAEVLRLSDEYLLDAERDLAKQASRVPTITNASVVTPVDLAARVAAERRAEAMAGNPVLAPSPSNGHANGAGMDLKTALRSAISETTNGRRLAARNRMRS